MLQKLKVCLLSVSVLALGFVGMGCGSSSDEGAGSVERPFEPARQTAVWSFNQTKFDGVQTTFTADWVGTKNIAGKEYGRLQAGSFGDPLPPEGTEVWIDWKENEVTFGGGEVYFPVAGVNAPGTPLVSGTTDAPVTIDLNPPLGVPQTFQATGSATLGDGTDPNNPYAVDAEVTYTLVETDVTVETSVGDVAGCRHFTGSASAYGMDFEGDAWYHPTLGMVAGHINWPEPNGTTLDLLGIQDFAEGGPDTGDIQAVGVIGPGSAPFKLDTYDVNGELDADKDRHAKMLLEIRWADDEMARSDTPPAAVVEFGTLWGFFPFQLVQSPISIFHPEENGKGYNYWVTLVDEAAKNESFNGIAYHITVSPADYASSKMRVTARILYRKAPAE